MKKFIFILGGARSGKSSYAVTLAKSLGKKVAFIATAKALDREMKKRIAHHRRSRPRHWKMIEEYKDIASALTKLKGKYELALIDCLGLLISNLLTANTKDKKIELEMHRLVKAISRTGLNVILVSNEVGCGIVPDNSLARAFRDALGAANQMMARHADEVIFMRSGIPLIIKGEKQDAKTE